MQNVKIDRSDPYLKIKCEMRLAPPVSKTPAVAQKDISSCDRTCTDTAVALNTIQKAHQQARKSYGPAAEIWKARQQTTKL